MGKFIVSARKYRPTQFDEVLGQQHITSTLKNALKNDHLAHAFLFCGPRGVGKTSCARILAKVINCDNITDNFESCGTCSSCESFDNNASFNIFEMDGASNNKVEHIHHLLDQVRVAPPPGKYKVFIIDEVHMLTPSAFNAFLKTLEEPPSYAIFILATTEKHKILPTILSRCQIYDFNRIQIDEMVIQLRAICTEEKIEADDNALQLIASKADGAMRDALSIFDRMASFKQGNIQYADILQNLNILDYDYFFKFVEGFLSEDLPSVMLLLDEILRKGFEGSSLTLGLSEHLRQLLVCQDPRTASLILGSEELKNRYQNQANYTNTSFLLSALSILNDCDVNYVLAKNKRLHVEIALSKLCFLHRKLESNLFEDPSKKKTSGSIEPLGYDPEPNKTKVKDSVDNTPTINEGSKSIRTVEAKAQQTPKSEVSSTAANETKLSSAFGLPSSAVPSIGSLKNLESALVEKEAELKRNAKSFNLKDTQEMWNAYAEKSSSPSVRQILKSAKLSIMDQTLDVEVGSALGRNAVLQETAIMNEIRIFFQNNDIVLNINIDPKRENENVLPKSKRLFSNKEIYELMLDKNTHLSKFQQKFVLKFDES